MTSLLLSGPLAACATVPPPRPIHMAEQNVICAMVKDIQWGPFGTVDVEEDLPTIKRLSDLAKDEDFQALPETLKCPGGRRRLHRPGQGVPFDSFWLSADGKRAAISGGWIGGALLGGGGICYYTRVNDAWHRDACVETWAA